MLNTCLKGDNLDRHIQGVVLRPKRTVRVGNEHGTLCVCVFFRHVMKNFVPIKHVDAAHQHLAEGRDVPRSIDGRGHVVMPPLVIPSVAPSCFSSQEAGASVSQAARPSLEATHMRSVKQQ